MLSIILLSYLIIILYLFGLFCSRLYALQNPGVKKSKLIIIILYNMLIAPISLYGAIKNANDSFIHVDKRLVNIREAMFELRSLNIGKAIKILSEILDGK